MSSNWFASPQWWHACTLAERSATPVGGGPARPAPAEKSARARRRFERWRDQPPFSGEATFAQRLALDGIDEAQFLALLDEPVERLRSRLPAPPGWLAQVETAFARPLPEPDDYPADAPGDEVTTPESPALEDQVYGLIAIVRPLIEEACDRLQAGVAALVANGPVPFAPATIEDVLLNNLPDALLMRLSRTLVLELHVARLQGLLAGGTPEARFQSFVERLRRADDALAILAEYPVLTRQVVLCINQWLETSLEFLERLCADWTTICDCFCPQDNPGALVVLTGGAGDTHRGGRSVMIAEFSSGFRLVYKPKSLAIDTHFQELVAWLNQRGCQPRLYTLAVVDRGDYGWVEYVARASCHTPDQITRFYERQGAYLALLYALNANDFHFENIIAAGEHPVLIDLETLLQPQFDQFDVARAESAAARVMAESVLQVGLLPARIWSTDDSLGVDISGLGGPAGQLSPDRLPQLVGTGTDAMHFTRERVELSGEAHRPMLGDVDVSGIDHVDDVITGFARMYRLLLAQAAELLASDGPLNCFARDEIRVLLRQTRTYDQLLSESFHPDMLRDALERDRFLDRLWIAVPERAYLARVVKAEQTDLQQGDIPIFTTHPSTLDLFSTCGVRIEGVLAETGVSVVDRRIRQLGEQDLRRQEWFIRTSFATVDAAADAPARPAVSSVTVGLPATNDRILAGAAAIAERLAATAIYGAEDVTWISLEQLDARNWDIRSSGIDLRDGIAGIALFLGYAGALLHDARHTALARRALNTLTGQIDTLREEMAAIGALDGWGGVLYTLTHLGVLWDDGAVLAHAAEVVDVIDGLVAEDDRYDIAGGAAGASLALLAYYRVAGSDKALASAVACGDHLLAAAQGSDQGIDWAAVEATIDSRDVLDRGVSGIAWALLELAAATGNDAYRVAALQALARQRSAPKSANEDAPAARGVAAAIDRGLACLCLLRHLDALWLRDDVQAVVAAAQRYDAHASDALSGGALGSLDLLRLAAGWVDDGPDDDQIRRWAGAILDGGERDGWRCGGPSGIEIPGLMLGLAGIGYGLLRLAEPERVPPVLVLAPPGG
jgi:type 2 lantibiotic biosynthesis protein LanM